MQIANWKVVYNWGPSVLGGRALHREAFVQKVS